jgi:hypothetical protein
MTSSEVDPYLTLWETTPYNPTAVVVESDDDDGEGLASRIHRTLSSGTYTVEATTYDNGAAGTFQLLLNASMGPDTVFPQGELIETEAARLGIDDAPDPFESDAEGPDLTAAASDRAIVGEEKYQLVVYGELRFAAGALEHMGATNDFDDFEIEITVSRYDPELSAQADQALEELQANRTTELLQEWTSLIRRLAHTSHWELPIALATTAEGIPLPYDSGTRSPSSSLVAGDSYRTFARYPGSRSEIRFSPVLQVGDRVTVAVIESDPFTPDRLGRINFDLTKDVVAEGMEFSSRYMAMRLRFDPVEFGAAGGLTPSPASPGEESSHREASTETPPLEGAPASSRMTTGTVEEASGNAETVANFDLDVSRGAGIARAYNRFYIVGSGNGKVHAYGINGARDTDADFELDSRNAGAVSITHVNDRFYVVDAGDDKVYAYGSDGTRNSGADFELVDGNDSPYGITYADDRFYVADADADRVYAYGIDGAHETGSDVDLSALMCLDHYGFEYAAGRFYVLCGQPGVNNFLLFARAIGTDGLSDDDASFTAGGPFSEGHGLTRFDGKLYVLGDQAITAYDIDSVPPVEVAGGFAYGENNGATGMVYTLGRFYVVDGARDRVYAYGADGFRDPGAEFDLDEQNGTAQGITYADGRFYVVDSDDKVYAYSSVGTRDADSDFELEDDSEPTGISYADGRFYVVGQHDKVYAYSIDGARDPAADVDLDDDNYRPSDITHADGRLYVSDDGGWRELDTDGRDVDNAGGRRYWRWWAEQKIYAYSIDGARDRAADVDLFNHPDPSCSTSPQGITYLDGLIYLLNGARDKVYSCGFAGAWDSEAGFYLADENGDPEGIAYGVDRFYVVDGSDDKVYVYGVDGTRDADAEFALVDENGDPEGIAYGVDRFYVVDGSDDEVYAYDTDGAPDVQGGFPIDGWSYAAPTGIGHVAGRFYVVDRGFDGRWGRPAAAYAYYGNRGTLLAQDSDAEFGFDDHNQKPSGITYADGRFFVVDTEDDMVYAYRIDGP